MSVKGIFDKETAEEIRRKYKKVKSYEKLSEEYFCSRMTIQHVVKRRGAYRKGGS